MLRLWRDQLLPLFAGPTIWSLHFLACYVLVAIVCEKTAGDPDSFWSARLAIAAFTAVALVAIAVAGFWAWRQTGAAPERHAPYDRPTQPDRRQFLGHTQLLLNAMSAVAVIYNALPALLIRSCI